MRESGPRQDSLSRHICNLPCPTPGSRGVDDVAENLLRCDDLVTPEKISETKEYLGRALDWIRNNITNRELRAAFMGQAFSNEDLNDMDMYIGLINKESRFRVDAVSRAGARGLMQIMRPAEADVINWFPSVESAFGRGAYENDPVANCVIGILYYHICIDRYAAVSDFGELRNNREERKLLGTMIYNGGFGTVRGLWRMFDPAPTSFEDFENKLGEAFLKQLGAEWDSFHRVVKDDVHQVCYREHPAITEYLRFYRENTAKLEQRFLVNGKDGGTTIRKVGEMLRYVRVLEALEEAKF